MAFNKYFLDELNYLRDLGAKFSEQNPTLSRYLSEDGDDPDVERLLEGFAFLSGRIRQKLDDEVPEISHSLLNLLWPNYLRPVPSFSVLEFTPKQQKISTKKTIKKGASVQSVEVEGSVCKFRTCYDVNVYPLILENALGQDKTKGSEIRLKFSFEPGIASEEVGLDKLRLYLHDDQKRQVSKILYLWFFRFVERIEVRVKTKDGKNKTFFEDPATCISPVGFDSEESLLPTSNQSFNGYRYIQEYFQLPEKFLFIDINELDEIFSLPNIESFELVFQFSRKIESQFRIKTENFRLYCTPIVNLFNIDADPIKIEHKRIEYMLRPQYKNLEHCEIFSVDNVFGRIKGQSKRVTYPPFESFEHQISEKNGGFEAFYKLNMHPSILGKGVDLLVSFISDQSQNKELLSETISCELTCSNRNLAEAIQTSEIIHDTGESPEFVSFKNITKVTPSYSPPLSGDVHWQLISNLALSYQSNNSVESLRNMVKHYDFKALNNRQDARTNEQICEGIEAIDSEFESLIIKGVLVRGLKTKLHLRESKFGAKGLQGEANMYVFCTILNGYFRQFAQVNSFHQLTVKAIESGEEYQWKMLDGTLTRQ